MKLYSRSIPTAYLIQLILGAVFLLPSLSLAKDYSIVKRVNTAARVSIDLKPLIESLPYYGIAPMRVSITNRSGEEQTYHFKATSSLRYHTASPSTEFSKTLVVPDRESQTFELYVPISNLNISDTYTSNNDFSIPQYVGQSHLIAHLEGYGIDNYQLEMHSRSSSLKLPFVAMSNTLALRSWSVIDAELEKRLGNDNVLHGSKFDPTMLPQEWFGYLGIARIMMTEDAWNRLPASTQHPIGDWITFGGQLHLFRTAEVVTEAEYGSPLSSEIQGLGKIEIFPWDGKEISLEYIPKLYADKFSGYSTRGQHRGPTAPLEPYPAQSMFKDKWPLATSLSAKFITKINQLIVFGFLFLYAVGSGPVLLRVLSQQRQRLKLFVFTPLISLASCLVLVAWYHLSAGYGTIGKRKIAVLLDSQAKKAYVMQEQVTKSAILLGSDFSLSSNSFIHTIPIKDREQKVTKADLDYYIDGTTYRGDWFRSQHVVGHYLMQIQNTRAALEVHYLENKTPQVSSRIRGVLKDVFIRDEEGTYWYASNVREGSPTNYKQIDNSVLNNWLISHLEGYSLKLGMALRTVRKSNQPFFIALSEHDSGFGIETLPGITWDSSPTLLYGPL